MTKAQALSEGLRIALDIDPNVEVLARSDEDDGDIFYSWVSLRFRTDELRDSALVVLRPLGWRQDGAFRQVLFEIH